MRSAATERNVRPTSEPHASRLMSPSSPRPQLSGPRAIPFQPPQGDLALMSGSANPVLAQAIANHLGVPLIPGRAHLFSDGNVFVRIKENVRGRDVFVIQGVHFPVNDNFMELL